MRCKGILFFSFLSLVILLSLSFISASYSLGFPTYDIQDTYEQGDRIKGWINISFTNEPLESVFVDNFGNTISLQTALEEDEIYYYNESEPNVTSEFQILSLNDLFIVTDVVGDLNYVLNFTGSILFSQTVTVNSSENLTLKVEAARGINNKKQALINFNATSNDFTGLIKEKINKYIDINSLQTQINELEIQYVQADSNEDYQDIIDEASLMKIPKLVQETKGIDNANFIPDEGVVDFSVLAGITDESYSELNRASYRNGLFVWSQDKIDTRINYKEISASYGESGEILFNYFKIQFLRNPSYDSYLIIERLKDLEFSGNVDARMYGNYYYINLGEDNYREIVFTTTEDVDFTTIPMFISPALENLPVFEDPIIDGKREMKISKWLFFGLIMAFLLVIGLVVYSIVSTWYDKKYENYLFPNRNNLYNLIIFVNNSKRKGVGDDEIVKSLKKSKWSMEQIKYVMKKYAGKRTGMAKLPFQKIQRVPNKPSPQPGRDMKPGPIRGPSGNLPGSGSRPLGQ